MISWLQQSMKGKRIESRKHLRTTQNQSRSQIGKGKPEEYRVPEAMLEKTLQKKKWEDESQGNFWKEEWKSLKLVYRLNGREKGIKHARTKVGRVPEVGVGVEEDHRTANEMPPFSSNTHQWPHLLLYRQCRGIRNVLLSITLPFSFPSIWV